MVALVEISRKYYGAARRVRARQQDEKSHHNEDSAARRFETYAGFHVFVDLSSKPNTFSWPKRNSTSAVAASTRFLSLTLNPINAIENHLNASIDWSTSDHGDHQDGRQGDRKCHPFIL